MKSMINVDNSKAVVKMAESIVHVLERIKGESDTIKGRALDALITAGNAPITISHNTFEHKR